MQTDARVHAHTHTNACDVISYQHMTTIEMEKFVQVCTKPPWCQELLNGLSDINSKPSMSSNGHLIIECLVNAVYSCGCTYQLCFNSEVLS